MNKQQTYYGIQFENNFTLNEKTCQQLAKLMFISPTISAVEAKRILKDSELLFGLKTLMNTIQCEITEISSKKQAGKFINKIEEWIKIFSFPTINEVIEVATIINIKEEVIINWFYLVLFNNLITSKKILDFLSKYAQTIDNTQIDKLLDLYNEKIKKFNNSTIQNYTIADIESKDSLKSYF